MENNGYHKVPLGSANRQNDTSNGRRDCDKWDGKERKIVNGKTAIKPGEFGGIRDEFKQWSMKVELNVGANVRDGKKLMQWAETMDREQIRIRDVIEWGKRNGIDDAEYLNEELYTALLSWTKDRALTTVHRCKDNGAEAWRQLHCQYNPRTMGNKSIITGKIHRPKARVSDSKLIETIEEWEEQVAKLYEMFSETISDNDKISRLMTMCNDDAAEVVYRHMDTGDFEFIKQKVIEYAQRKEERRKEVSASAGVYQVDGNENCAEDDYDWDLDALTHKGGKYGKNNGKGKGKGKCYNCGKSGHWSNECSLPPQVNCFKCGQKGHKAIDCTATQSKGKGKGKSKGKKGMPYGKGINEFAVHEEDEMWDGNDQQEDNESDNIVGGISEDIGEQQVEEEAMYICAISENDKWMQPKKVWKPKEATVDNGKGENTWHSQNKFEALGNENEEDDNMMTVTGDEREKWKKVTITVDSGATISVIPENVANKLPVVDSKASTNKTKFRAANGGIITSRGRREVHGKTDTGIACKVGFEVCGVSKTLGAVCEMIDSGNKVVFDSTGCYILNKKTMKKTELTRRGGAFEFDVWYNIGDETKSSF